MHLRRLALADWRNIGQATLELEPGFNVFQGDNAQGKTNLLEAVYLLATLKSFRGARNSELVRFGAEQSAVAATATRRSIERELRVDVTARVKAVSVDGKRVRSIQDAFGHLQVVLFAPEDLAVSKGAAEKRRTFLDRAIFNLMPACYEDLREYERAVRSRNLLLKEGAGRAAPGMLEVFDAAVATTGARILTRRLGFVRDLRPRFHLVHQELAGADSEAGIDYESSLGLSEDATTAQAEAALHARLASDRQRDLRVGHTTSGPHTDDLRLSLDGRPARIHASQGQHRTLVLAMKIAEIAHQEAALGYRPILLLDDVSSELDRGRNGQLMAFLAGGGGQVLITTTDAAYLGLSAPAARFGVREGRVTREEGS